jgi:DNA polymerase/3'-5' exonuclease PolX
MDKNKILDEFKKLQQQIMFDIDNTTGMIKLRNQYRLKSITTAVKALEKYNKNKILEKDLSDIQKLKGVGEGTIRRIKEILDTGKLSEIKITESDKQYLKMIEELEEIYGIGRITAYKLFKEHKIKSIDEFIDKINKKEISVPENILKGLKYVKILDTKIPVNEITEINEFILNTMFEIDIKLFGTTCGSYRRQIEISGDAILSKDNLPQKKSNSFCYDVNSCKDNLPQKKSNSFCYDVNSCKDNLPQKKSNSFCSDVNSCKDNLPQKKSNSFCSDVDFIIIHHDYKTSDTKLDVNYLDIVVSRLIKKNFIIDSLTKSDVKTKYMGIFKWKNSQPRRIDIRLFPLESYYSALLYFTGSKDFNRQMRLNAIAHDYTLNEYGLFDEKNKLIKVNSEKELFDILGMEYVDPSKR